MAVRVAGFAASDVAAVSTVAAAAVGQSQENP